MDSATLYDFREHICGCDSCARYDTVVGEGAKLYRDYTEIEPGCDFLPRLQHRIFHVEEDAARLGQRASGTSVLFTTAIAGMIGLAAWAPLVRPAKATLELPSVAAHAPHRSDTTPVLFRSGPLLDDRVWTEPNTGPPIHSLFFEYSPMGAQAQVHTASNR